MPCGCCRKTGKQVQSCSCRRTAWAQPDANGNPPTEAAIRAKAKTRHECMRIDDAEHERRACHVLNTHELGMMTDEARDVLRARQAARIAAREAQRETLAQASLNRVFNFRAAIASDLSGVAAAAADTEFNAAVAGDAGDASDAVAEHVRAQLLAMTMTAHAAREARRAHFMARMASDEHNQRDGPNEEMEFHQGLVQRAIDLSLGASSSSNTPAPIDPVAARDFSGFTAPFSGTAFRMNDEGVFIAPVDTAEPELTFNSASEVAAASALTGPMFDAVAALPETLQFEIGTESSVQEALFFPEPAAF
jgi:hypothetical protein